MFEPGLAATRSETDSSLHASADSLPYWNTGRIKILQAENIDAEVVGRDAFPVEGINAADLAEKVPCCMGMELIL